MGIKSLKCNFNPGAKTYNPHFHIIVPDCATAEFLRSEWLKLWTIEFAQKRAQKIIQINGREDDIDKFQAYDTYIKEVGSKTSAVKPAGSKKANKAA